MTKSMAAMILMAASAAAAAGPSDADMARCAAIGPRDARLDCFDALALQSSKKPPAVAATESPRAPPAGRRAAAPVAAQSSEAAVSHFGLPPVPQDTPDLGLKMIRANISGLGADQSGRMLVLLDNGQTWSVSGDDGWLSEGQAVRIRRASVGTFLLLNAANHSYRARRVK
jgi:hypothetical protein